MSIFEGIYLSIDYRSNKVNFRPPVDDVRIVEAEMVGKLPLVGIFFKEEAFKIADWIVQSINELDSLAVVSVWPSLKGDLADISVSLNINSFPAILLAKKYRLERILEREIEKIDLALFACRQLAVRKERFRSVFCQDMRECGVAILDACYEREHIKDCPLTIFPAIVDVRLSEQHVTVM